MVRCLYHILLTALFTLSLSACGGGVVYNKYVPVPLEGWETNDTAVFDVPKFVSGGRYRQELGVRVTGEYPFTGLSLLVELTVEPGHKTYVDTVDCRIFSGNGDILGSGVGYYQYTFSLPDVDLDEGDSLHVCVRHIMRREILTGVSDIGLKIYP